MLIGPLGVHTSQISFENGTLSTVWGLAPTHALLGNGTINADHCLRISNGASLASSGEHRIFGGVDIEGVNASWDLDGALFLGDRHPATLDITGGDSFMTGEAAVGQNRLGESDARADVLVDGAGSLWTIEGNLTLGGTTRDNIPPPGDYRGTLSITDGGVVTAAGALFIDTGMSGSFISFDNGTLNVESALALPEHLRGIGTINADYWLISGDYTLSDFASLPSQLVYDQLPDQNIIVNLAWSDPSANLAFFGVDDGTVTINSGLSISSDAGYVALAHDAVGVLAFDGAGTAWVVSQDLTVGVSGNGTLRVQGGALADADRFIVGEMAALACWKSSVPAAQRPAMSCSSADTAMARSVSPTAHRRRSRRPLTSTSPTAASTRVLRARRSSPAPVRCLTSMCPLSRWGSAARANSASKTRRP